MILYGFFRSSASWRVRIALGLKGLPYETVSRRLRKGEQTSADHLAVNPQGLVPALDLGDGRVLTQSLAICEYLEETHPDPPLLPGDPYQRAKARAFAQVIACDTHPLQNLKVLQRVRALGHDEAQAKAWARTAIQEGLDACEVLADAPAGGFCFGAQPSLADLCLVPQLGNARRFGMNLRGWPRLLAVEAACNALPAFAAAAPENQPDAE